MSLLALLISVLACDFHASSVDAFMVASPLKTGAIAHSQTSRTSLHAGGFGATSTATPNKKGRKSKPGKNKKKIDSTSSGGGGMPAFDVGASLMRLEKRYDELSQADAKQFAKDSEDGDDAYWKDGDRISTEYVVAVRATPSPDSSSSSSSAATDWIPISQMLLSRPWSSYDPSNNGNNEDDAVSTRPLLQAAVSLYCRELAQMALLSSRVAFASVPRNKIEYAVEPISSWYKYVHDNVLEKPKHKQQDNSDGDGAIYGMSKTQALEILGMGGSHDKIDRGTLKRSYRNLSLQCHPDRMIDATQEEQEAASQKFATIKHAYELLISSSSGTSWYESLGGKERTDFVKFLSNNNGVNGAAGQMALISIGKANTVLEAQDIHSAVVPLDPELVQSFVARNMQR